MAEQKTLESLSKEERSLLLFLECRETDHGGLVDVRHMNEVDFDIAKRWTKENFLFFGRILSADFDLTMTRCRHFVIMSAEARQLAIDERTARAIRSRHSIVKRYLEKRDSVIRYASSRPTAVLQK